MAQCSWTATDPRRTRGRFEGPDRGARQPPCVPATVLVGDDKPSQIYVRNKRKKAEEAGMVSRHVELPGDISQPDLEAAVRDLADDPAVHGILVQLPLPDGLDAERILDLLRRRRTSTASPSARWADSFVVATVTFLHPARGDASDGALRRRDRRQEGGRHRSLHARRVAPGSPAWPQRLRCHADACPQPFGRPGRDLPEADIIVAAVVWPVSSPLSSSSLALLSST